MEGPRGWARPLHGAVLDAADVGPGTALLDVGCGTGEFARAAADRGAVVTGVDVDPEAVARAAEAVPEGRFAVGDAHDLGPVPPVDVVAAVQLLAHVANPLRVMREAARAARPWGLVVATVWGREQECDVRVYGEALAPWLPSRPPPGGPPPVTEPDRLRWLAGAAGLAVDALEEVTCTFTYPDASSLLGPLLASGIGRSAVARAGAPAVSRAVLGHLAPYRTADGGYRLHNLFRVMTARPAPR